MQSEFLNNSNFALSSMDCELQLKVKRIIFVKTHMGISGLPMHLHLYHFKYSTYRTD
jgi:hypothetical protein